MDVYLHKAKNAFCSSGIEKTIEKFFSFFFLCWIAVLLYLKLNHTLSDFVLLLEVFWSLSYSSDILISTHCIS